MAENKKQKVHTNSDHITIVQYILFFFKIRLNWPRPWHNFSSKYSEYYIGTDNEGPSSHIMSPLNHT